LLILLLGFSIPAQTINGTLTGIVFDATGAVVPNVQVTIRNLDTGITREVVTDGTGRYHAPALPIGRYAIALVAAGFEKVIRQPIQVDAAVERAVDVTLQPGVNQQVVSIIAEAPLIQTTQSQLSRGVESKRILELPLGTNTMNALALMSPGATPNQNGRPGSGFAINGGRTRSNYFTLDGANNIDQSLATARQTMPAEYLGEFRIITNNFSAEFGRNSGSVVQQLTKSGTNDFHGMARWSWLGNGLDALTTDEQRVYNSAKNRGLSDYLATRAARGVKVRNQGLVDAAGPIKKNRVFFFTGYDQEWYRTTAVPTASVLSPDAVRQLDENASRFASGALQFLKSNWPTANDPTPQGSVTIQAPTGVLFTNGTNRLTLPLATQNRGLTGALAYGWDQYRFLQRVDARLTDSDNLSARYVIDDYTDPGSPSAIPGQEIGQVSRNQSVTVNETHVFSATALNELRFTFGRRAIDFPEKLDAQLQVVGLPILGNQNYPQYRKDNLYEWNDNLSMMRGSHNLRMGGNMLRYELNSFFAPSLRGVLYYPSVGDLLFDRSASWQQYAGDGMTAGTTWEYAGYFQDDWRASSSLTLNLGIRYEFSTAPYGFFSEAKPDKNNWAPRFGFAWAPRTKDGLLGKLFGDGRTSIRGGYSIAYDQVFQNILLNNSRNFPRGVSVTRGPEDNTRWYEASRRPPAPTPDDYIRQGRDPNLLPVRLYSPGTNIKQPMSQQYSFGIERQLFSNYAARVFYVGSRASGLVREVERNLGFTAAAIAANSALLQPIVQSYGMKPVTSAAGAVTGYRVDPRKGSILVGDGLAMSTFHSLQTTLQKRYANGFAFEANYTYSSFINDSDDILGGQNNNTLPAVPFNFKLDRARSGFDLPHRFVSNFVYEFPAVNNGFGLAGRLLSGWQINGVTTIQNGVPYTLLNANNALGILPGQIATVTDSQRPSYNPSGAAGTGTSPAVTNPMYVANPVNSGIIGNVGRNTERTGATKNMDGGVTKFTNLFGGDKPHRIMIRWEIYNALNHRNFNVIPNRTVSNSTNNETLRNLGYTSGITGRGMIFTMRYEF
jgi:hypothetical protein